MGSKHKKERKKESKKDKKHKKDRKEKKHKSSKSDERSENQLSIVLTGILLDCPQLLDELPQIVTAFNNGEFVQIRSISNQSMKDGLLLLMKYLPAMKENPQYGWYYDRAENQNQALDQFILTHLLDSKIIAEPKKLSISEQSSSRSAPSHLLSLIQQFPTVKDEIQIIFQQILDGNMVQLQDLPDDELIAKLEKLFKSLGLSETSDGYGIPSSSSSSSSSSNNAKQIRETVQLFCNIFKSYDKYKKVIKEYRKQEYGKSSKRKREENTKQSLDASASDNDNSDAASSNSSASSPSASDAEEHDGSNKKILGPAMPSKQEMKRYQTQTNFSAEAEEDEDDDDIGPKVNRTYPSVKISQSKMPENQPLGFVGYTNLEENSEALEQIDDETEPKEIKDREEWILNPGESRAYSELNGVITNRKFQSGKQAKKLAEKYQIQKAYQRSIMEQEGTLSVEQKDEDDQPAKPSLMEEHLSKRQRTNQSQQKDNTRRAFDRDKDLLATKKLNIQEIQHLVQNAKELNTKFDKAIVQRTFL